jgi:hypothetical protein
MSLNQLLFQTRQHRRSVPPPATRLLSSRTFVCWATTSVPNIYDSSTSYDLFPLLLKTPFERSPFSLALCSTRVTFLFLLAGNSSPRSRRRPKSSSHHSPNSLVARLTAWVDESAHDGDHAQVRLLSIPHFWLTGLLMTARSYVFMCAASALWCLGNRQ